MRSRVWRLARSRRRLKGTPSPKSQQTSDMFGHPRTRRSKSVEDNRSYTRILRRVKEQSAVRVSARIQRSGTGFRSVARSSGRALRAPRLLERLDGCRGFVTRFRGRTLRAPRLLERLDGCRGFVTRFRGQMRARIDAQCVFSMNYLYAFWPWCGAVS